MAYWDYFDVQGVGLKGSASAYVAARSGNQIKVHIDYWMDYYYDGNSSWLSWQGWNQYSGATTIHEGGYAHSGSASAYDEFWVNVGYGSGSIDLLPSIGADWDFVYNQNLVLNYSSNYSAPTAPTIGSVVKLSDTKARVSFTGNTSDQKPYTSIQILRSTDGGSYVQVAEVGWSSQTSYDDTSISANHRYRYKVSAKNSAGTSANSSASNTIYTTPSAPSSLKAVYNTGSSSVNVTWKNNANNVSSYQVQSANNRSFSGATTISASSSSLTDSNPPMGTAYYRVRAVDQAGNTSSWSNIVQVTTLCAPAAPTMVNPSHGSVFAMPSTVSIEWSHNSLDGTSQSSAKVAVSTNGGTTWTEYTVSGSSGTYVLNTSSMARDTEIKVKVKTKGTYASYGPYCSEITFSLRESPIVTITLPATDVSEVTTYPINTSWQNVCRSGSIVETIWELDDITHSLGTDTSYSLNADEKLLANKTEYVLKVTVRSSYGLTATAERRFTTDYTEPAPPQIEVAYDIDAGAATVVVHANDCGIHECDGTEVAESLCSITFREITRYFIMPNVASGDILLWSGNEATLFLNRAGSGIYEIVETFVESQEPQPDDIDLEDATPVQFTVMVAADHYVLYRITDGGEELLSDSLAAGGSIIDRVPPLNVEYRYRGGSIAISGSTSFMEKSALLENDGWFLWNFGESFEDKSRLKWEPEDGESIQNDSESVLFEGDEYPTCFGGSADIVDLSMSAVAIGNSGRLSVLRGIGGWKGRRAIFRTPYGDVFPVRVHSVSAKRSDVPSNWNISVGQERVL